MKAEKLFPIKIINWIPLKINTARMLYNGTELSIHVSIVTLPHAL